MSNPRISVIVCTNNEEKSLKECITSLINQSLPKNHYEIIVVDNNPKYNSRKIINQFKKEDICYFQESKPGLSNARNLGIEKSKAEYIAFIDADAIAHKNWLKNIITAFKKTAADSVGGKILPIFEIKKPNWIHKKLEVFLSILDYGNTPKFLKSKSLFGTNIAFKKPTLEKFKGFNIHLGRKRDSLLSGEELFIQNQIKKSGNIYYSPEIKVYHSIKAYRLTKQWFKQRAIAEGKTNALISLYENPSSNKFYKITKKVLCIILNPLLIIGILSKSNNGFLNYQKVIGTIRVTELKTLISNNQKTKLKNV